MKLINNLSDFDNIPPTYIRKNKGSEYTIVKYSKRAFYDQAWNQYPLLVQARGHIFDNETGDIVARPFDKVFNYSENGTGVYLHDDTPVYLTEKINGFLGVLTQINGELYISTSGSLCKYDDAAASDNDYLRMFAELISPDDVLILPGYSYMFEVVHQDNPHIIKQAQGCYFLGMRNIDTGVFSMPRRRSLKLLCADIGPVDVIETTLATGLHIAKESCGEGYMISHAGSGLLPINAFICKVKSRKYLITKFLARASIANIEKQHTDEEIQMIVNRIDELYSLERFKAMDEQQRIEILEEIV